MSITEKEVKRFADELGHDQEVIITAAEFFQIPGKEFEETIEAIKRVAPTKKKLSDIELAYKRKREVMAAIEGALHCVDHLIWHLLTKMVRKVWSYNFVAKEGSARVVYEIPNDVALPDFLEQVRSKFSSLFRKRLEIENNYHHKDHYYNAISIRNALYQCSHESYKEFFRWLVFRELFPKQKYTRKAFSQVDLDQVFTVNFLKIGREGHKHYFCCPHETEINLRDLWELNGNFDIEITGLKRKGAGRKGLQKVEIRFRVWTKEPYGFNLPCDKSEQEQELFKEVLPHIIKPPKVS